jgi:hypothetical protein
MNQTREIAGYECNCILSRNGRKLRSVAVLVGEADRPGARVKDGQAAKDLRRAAKRAVMATTGLPADAVRVVARYSCLATHAVARRAGPPRGVQAYPRCAATPCARILDHGRAAARSRHCPG